MFEFGMSPVVVRSKGEFTLGYEFKKTWGSNHPLMDPRRKGDHAPQGAQNYIRVWVQNLQM